MKRKIQAWIRLLLLMGTLAVFTGLIEFVIMGSGKQSAIHKTILEKDIDATALFYTESEKAVDAIRKLEKMRVTDD